MYSKIPIVVCIQLVTLYFSWLCAFESGRRFKYSVSDWRKCDTGNDEFRMFRNIPIQECLFECRIRKRCKAVKFLAIRRECGLLETAVNKASDNNNRPCAFIRMADVEDLTPIPSICQTCSLEEACEFEEERCAIREMCARDWYRIGQSCYHFSHDQLTFRMADINCQRRRAHLIHIETEKKNEEIINLCQDVYGRLRRSWIGITDTEVEGVWKYTQTNVIANFFSWYKTDPNGRMSENCVMIGHYIKKWIDVQCSWKATAICEKRL